MSDKLTKQMFRALQRLTPSVLLLLVPINFASAQEFEKVETRLKQSVADGHLTQQQARAMMETLRRMAVRDTNVTRPVNPVRNRAASSTQSENQARKSVAAETTSGEVGRTKKNKTSKQQASGEELLSAEAKLAEYAMKIRQAVKNGRIKAEDAPRYMAGFKKKLASATSAEHFDETRLQRAADRLRLAVENGDLTSEEARRKFQAIKDQHRERNDQGAVDASQRNVDSGPGR